jgi:hypothetical protein
MNLKESSKETRKKWIKTTILKLWNSDYKKGEKPKLEHEEQREKRRRNCSLELSPENVHQSKLKHEKLKWYTWENPNKPQKMHP